MSAGVVTSTRPPAQPPSARRRAHFRRNRAPVGAWVPVAGRAAWIGYGIPPLVIALASLSWFSPGAFIASGDISPFVRRNLSGEVFSVWNHQVSGAGSASYAIAQLLDVALLRGTGALGLPPAAAQHLLYLAIFCFAAFSVSYLAGVWIRRPGPIAAAGLVAVFNPYVLVNFPNLLPVLAIGLIAALSGLVLRAGAGARVRPAALALLTLPVSYLAQNPPLVVVVALAVFAVTAAAALLTAPGGARRAGRTVSRASVLALLLDLFWIVPYALTLRGGAGLNFTAQTDVGAWAWTQVRASVVNVLTLNTHWGWNDPAYFPYAPALSHGLQGAARWVLPGLAAVGLGFAARPRRRIALTLAAAALVLIAVGKGLNAPLGSVNGWAYVHVPGMWLLRDPMSKVGAVLVVIYALGVALALDRVADWARAHPRRHRPPASRSLRAWAGLAVATAATLIAVSYPSPLFTGAAVAGQRSYLPSSRVRIPVAWQHVAAAIDGASSGGKVAVFPLDPYYQVTTNWGYHGVDTIPAQLMSTPVLQELPGGYFGPTAGVGALLEGTQTSLLTGDAASVPERLRALGVTSLIVRKDLLTTPEVPPAADPALLAATLDRTSGIRLVTRTAVADVYTVTPGQSAVGELVQIHAEDADALSAAVANLAPGTVATTDSALPVNGVSWQVGSANVSQSFTLARAGRYRVALSATATSTFQAQVEGGAESPYLHLTDADAVTLDATAVPARPPISIPLDTANIVGLAAGADLIPVPSAAEVDLSGTGLAPTAVLSLSAQTQLTAYTTASPSVSRSATFGPLGDCNRYDSQTSAQDGLSLVHQPNGDLTLTAAAHTACTRATVPITGGADTYRIRFDYRSTQGEPARFCLWQQGPNTCAVTQNPAASGPGWHTYTGLAHVADSATGLAFYLYADGPSTGLTVLDYRNVSIDALRVAGAATVGARSAQPEYRSLAAGSHTITFRSSALSSTATAGFSALADCHNTTGPNGGQTQQSLTRSPDGAVTLAAGADTACVTAQPAVSDPTSLYRLALDYRTLSGRPARICVWQVGPNRCADTPVLPADPRWRTLSTLIRVQPGTRSLTVYLYADGQRNPLTSVQYQHVDLQRAAPLSIAVTADQSTRPGAAAAAPDAAVGLIRDSPTRYHFTARNITTGTALVLPESFATGWALSGLPRGWTARHFLANGYANGWLISGSGSATLTASYAPQRWADAAQWISALTALILIGWLVSRVRPGRRQRNAATSSPAGPGSRARRARRARRATRITRAGRAARSAASAVPEGT